MDITQKLADAFNLTPSQSQLLAALYTAVEIVPIDDANAVLIYRLGRQIKRRGIMVNTERNGFVLSDESRAAISKAIEMPPCPHCGLSYRTAHSSAPRYDYPEDCEPWRCGCCEISVTV